jgi:hypothetical protein
LGLPKQFYTAVCEERTCTRKAEESPLLEAVAGEQLVKKQQVGKRLIAGALVICKVWRSAMAL